MPTAKDIKVLPIKSSDANGLITKLHYSKSFVRNSQLHLGVFLNGSCEGVMQFGPPMSKEKVIHLVAGTKWNSMLELNRMAFSDRLPRNSESRALGVALRLIRKKYPHIDWILSYSDATQCGDGTIYRASGFVLTGIKQNKGLLRMPDGSVKALMTLTKGKRILSGGGGAVKPTDAIPLDGFQLRYIYFLNPEAKKRLTVPILPFSDIALQGAEMYRGEKRAGSKDNVASGFQSEEGGATPTPALQKK